MERFSINVLMNILKNIVHCFQLDGETVTPIPVPAKASSEARDSAIK